MDAVREVEIKVLGVATLTYLKASIETFARTNASDWVIYASVMSTTLIERGVKFGGYK